MIKNNPKHRWNTKSFVNRTSKLNRENLEKLYPSESWALFRIVPKVNNVIDLGCGNGAMSDIVNKINKKCKYTGLDHQGYLIKKAKTIYRHSSFLDQDLKNFVDINKKNYDLVMMWSVIKSIKDWQDTISKSLNFTKKFLIFDIRVVKGKIEKFDEKILHARYGSRKGAQLVLGYKNIKQFLLKQRKIKKIEIAGYKSDWGKNVIYNFKHKETFLITVVIHKNNNKPSNNKIDLYEQIPRELIK